MTNYIHRQWIYYDLMREGPYICLLVGRLQYNMSGIQYEYCNTVFLSVFVCPYADGGLYTWIIAKCRLSCRYHLSRHFVKRCSCLQTYFSCLQRVFLMLSNLLEQYWSFWPPPLPPKNFLLLLILSTALESNKKVHTRSVV